MYEEILSYSKPPCWRARSGNEGVRLIMSSRTEMIPEDNYSPTIADGHNAAVEEVTTHRRAKNTFVRANANIKKEEQRASVALLNELNLISNFIE